MYEACCPKFHTVLTLVSEKDLVKTTSLVLMQLHTKRKHTLHVCLSNTEQALRACNNTMGRVSKVNHAVTISVGARPRWFGGEAAWRRERENGCKEDICFELSAVTFTFFSQQSCRTGCLQRFTAVSWTHCSIMHGCLFHHLLICQSVTHGGPIVYSQ